MPGAHQDDGDWAAFPGDDLPTTADSNAATRARSRRGASRAQRELTYDELFVPQSTKVNEEWARNNAIFNYRLARSGIPGKLYVWSVVAFIVISFIVGIVQWFSSH